MSRNRRRPRPSTPRKAQSAELSTGVSAGVSAEAPTELSAEVPTEVPAEVCSDVPTAVAAEEKPSAEALREAVRVALEAKSGAPGRNGRRTPPPGRAPATGPDQGQFKG
ncbi:MAG: hypothetical protein H0V92_11000, partial [Pseudonocardiales bacterium]|nr:hypothetical protein [Pseudonocardiales bacterium]